jgi:hypothetical protein
MMPWLCVMVNLLLLMLQLRLSTALAKRPATNQLLLGLLLLRHCDSMQRGELLLSGSTRQLL